MSQTSRELRDARTQSIIKQAREAFKNHEIVEEGDRWWFLAERVNGKALSTYATSVFCDHFGCIYVGGDIDTVVYGYYSDYSDPKKRLKWIGQCEDLEYYVNQKAALGLGNRALTTSFDSNIAIAEIKEYTNEVDLNPDNKEALIDIIQLIRDGNSPEYIYSYMQDHIDYELLEELTQLGAVISSRVIYAWVALGKLCELLEV